MVPVFISTAIAGRKWVTVLLVVLMAVIAAASLTHYLDTHQISELHGTDPMVHSGPWGDLQEWDMQLEQPREYLDGLIEPENRWALGTLPPRDVQKLLTNSGCSEELASRLMRSLEQDARGNSSLTPDKESLLALSSDVRANLYLTLSQNPANIYMKDPVHIPHGNPEKLFSSRPDLYSKIKKFIEKLCYQRNGYTYFSDVAFVKNQLLEEKDRLDFMKSLSAQKVVNARLLITRDTDIDKPINYWGISMNGVLLKDLRPLFEAEKALPNGGSVSILYLLPPLARGRLYTTPLPMNPQAQDKPLPDCHWTALNFFMSNPDDRMRDNAYAYQYLMDHYYPIDTPGVAGDLVALKDTRGLIVHSSVYLADDLVFTKNGVAHSQPWVLMHIKDMVARYSGISALKVCYYRLRGL